MERSTAGASQNVPGAGEVLPPGTRLGEYAIDRIIGSGGMGTVYAAWHPVLRSRAAVKVLNPDVSHSATMVERFVSEAQAASRITHPNIIKVFGFGELPDGRKYFVMEYLEGETMTAWLARGRPDPGEALDLLLQVCEALEAAHREGIVHRDLKPDNLWIARPKHGRPYIKVLDFGIAKAIEGPLGKSNTQSGLLLGTPQFMSPEQCTGRSVDLRTDLYAMGGILYSVYCGRPPFERESPAELVAAHLYDTVPMPSVFGDVPPGLEALILACLEKDPAKRPASAAELANRLRAAAAPAAMSGAGRSLPRTAKLLAATVVEPPPPIEPDNIGDGPVDEPLHPARHARRWIASGVAVMAGAAMVWLAARGSRHTTGTPTPIDPRPPAAAAPPTPGMVRQPVDVPTLAPLPAPAPVVPMAERAKAPLSNAPPRHLKRRPVGMAPPSEPPPAPEPPKQTRSGRAGLIEENPFR